MRTQIFWVVTPCCWVSSFRRFEVYVKGESTKLLRNVGNLSPNDTASHLRTQ